MSETVETAVVEKPNRRDTLHSRVEKLIVLAGQVEVDPLTGEVTTGIEEFEAAKGTFEEKAAALAVAIRLAKGDAESLKKYKQDIADRQKSTETQIARLEQYLASEMNRAGVKRLDTVEARVTLKDIEAVEVTDEQLVPMEYKKIKWEVSKTAIRDAINNGETVDGARMVTHRSVIIK